MENTHIEEKNVNEEVNDTDALPIVIDKQPCTKQEKQSKAQLETLCHGRERNGREP